VSVLNKRPEVILDLAEIHTWISERNLDAAERFLRAVDRTFGQINQHPGLGWSRSWKSPKLRGVRSWRVKDFPEFLIFYREEKEATEIYAVLRGSRHLELALEKR
jgi:toxin ParE1/3/4